MPNLLPSTTAAFALIFSLWTAAPAVHADAMLWKSNGPPAGVDTIAVAPSDPKIVYAGSTGTDGGKGVFKSADGGRTWAAVNHGITNRRINAVAVDPLHSEIVYAGYEGEGFYKTADGGENWATINTAPVHHGTAIAIDPVDTNVLYLGTDSGMFKSIDGGKTLARLNNGQPEVGSVVRIVIDPHDRRTVYISKYNDKLENCGIWKSTDAGASWNAASTGIAGGPERQLGPNQKIDAARMTFGLTIDPQQPGVLYAGTLGGGVFKTTDGAAHWIHSSDGINTGMSFGNNVYSLAVDPRNSGVVYAGTAGGGIFKTSDAGKHWVGESQGLPPQSEHGDMVGIIWALTLDPKTRTLYAAHYGDSDGVYAASLP
ncbi:MAG: hypothetical protein JWP03_863 [Phycisphaerales bacterium]|nr:hypothetical protein [Phycisphaerales bacterium]